MVPARIRSRTDPRRLIPIPVALLGAGIGLAVLEQAQLHLRCPLHQLTGLYCPLCGGTRCVQSLLHGSVGAALQENALVLVAGAVLAARAAVVLLLGAHRVERLDAFVARVPPVGWVVLAILWSVLRNLPPCVGVLRPA